MIKYSKCVECCMLGILATENDFIISSFLFLFLNLTRITNCALDQNVLWMVVFILLTAKCLIFTLLLFGTRTVVLIEIG